MPISTSALERLIAKAATGATDALTRLSRLAGKPISQESAAAAAESGAASLNSLSGLPSRGKRQTGEDVLRLFEQHDPNAREAAVNLMGKFIKQRADSYIPTRGTEHYDDLIQAGNEAVLKGISKFKPEHGSLEGWLRTVIRQDMGKYLRDKGNVVKVPQSLQADKKRLDKKVDLWKKLTGREPSLEELSAQTGLDPQRLDELRAGIGLRSGVDPIRGSLAKSREYTGKQLEKVPESLRASAPTLEKRTELMDRMSTLGLKDREISILKDTLGLGPEGPIKQRDIAKKYGISAPRVNNILKRTIQRIQQEHPEWKPPRGISGGSDEPFGFVNIPEGSSLNKTSESMKDASGDVRSRISDVLRDFRQGRRAGDDIPEPDSEIVRQLRSGRSLQNRPFAARGEEHLEPTTPMNQLWRENDSAMEIQRSMDNAGYEPLSSVYNDPQINTPGMPLLSTKGGEWSRTPGYRGSHEPDAMEAWDSARPIMDIKGERYMTPRSARPISGGSDLTDMLPSESRPNVVQNLRAKWDKEDADRLAKRKAADWEDEKTAFKAIGGLAVPLGAVGGYLYRDSQENNRQSTQPRFKTFDARDTSMRQGFTHPSVGVRPDERFDFSGEPVSRERLHLLRELNRRKVPYTIEPDTKEGQPSRLRYGAES
jgi:RNA polymerase sigma factor (sigma-70 family)